MSSDERASADYESARFRAFWRRVLSRFTGEPNDLPGTDLEIDQAMTCNLIQHMVEKADTRRYIGGPGAIEVDVYRYLCFSRCTCDPRLT